MICLDPLKVADLASGFLWAIVYVLILRRGFLDQRSGVPLLALAPAITWELIYGLIRPTPELPRFVPPVWLAIDACILLQYLRDGLVWRRGEVSPVWFVARFAAAMLGAYVIEYTVIRDFGDRDGAYTGFAVNMVMSLAFIAMLEQRRDVRGQSMYIAIAKLAGSALAIPHAYVLHGALWSLRAFMAATLIGDVVYAVLLYRQCRAQGIRPWTRL